MDIIPKRNGCIKVEVVPADEIIKIILNIYIRVPATVRNKIYKNLYQKKCLLSASPKGKSGLLAVHCLDVSRKKNKSDRESLCLPILCRFRWRGFYIMIIIYDWSILYSLVTDMVPLVQLGGCAVIDRWRPDARGIIWLIACRNGNVPILIPYITYIVHKYNIYIVRVVLLLRRTS